MKNATKTKKTAPATLSKDLAKAIKYLLEYSFGPICWTYNDLTLAEQKLITREQFTQLAQWVKEKS